MSKVAVASSDGITINEHFGSASVFLIYEVFENGEYNLIDRRSTSKDVDNSVEHSNAINLAELLQDVEAVLVAQIGKNAEKILQTKGIRAFALNSTIDKALQTYGKKSRFIKNLSLGCSGCSTNDGGCSSGCR